MLVTTTPTIQGKTILEYKEIVFGEVVIGINFIKDIGAGFRNVFGGRSQGYEDEIIQARKEAIDEMQRRAQGIGANAIIGVDIDYEVLGTNMMMVIASGTAVIVE